MQTYPEDAAFKLICVVVNYGEGSRVLKFAREIGIRGGTIYFGRGTDTNGVMEFFGLGTVRKEILIMVIDRDSDTALKRLDKEFTFAKPRHGIAFSKPIASFLGSKDHIYNQNSESRGAEKMEYHVITVIVNKGSGELAVEAARAAGATGGTIINARGAGTHETSKLFFIEIEPEKEVVIIASKADVTDAIYQSIREKLELDKPGTGIMFKENVDEACGID